MKSYKILSKNWYVFAGLLLSFLIGFYLIHRRSDDLDGLSLDAFSGVILLQMICLVASTRELALARAAAFVLVGFWTMVVLFLSLK